MIAVRRLENKSGRVDRKLAEWRAKGLKNLEWAWGELQETEKL